MPDVKTGKQCTSPYNCPYKALCEPLDPPRPEHPIELLPDAAGKKLANKLHLTKGYTSILDPTSDELQGAQADLYFRIQQAHRTGQQIVVPGADEVLAGYGYPRYYFDFEGIDLPVPLWTGVRPYEQIPFQWSCHIERAPGVFDHGEFLDLSGNDPSLACIQQMQKVINQYDNGPIFVYFATYERGRLQELKQRHPQYADLLQPYIDRLVDLLPIVKQHFYHPSMQGSFSIKKVLPVIAPDLDYGSLDEVHDGTGAQVAYLKAALEPHVPAQQKAETESNLRHYCRQDTWAMVEVAYFLAGVGRPVRPYGM
ncbi:DUF2779 domain-containing protein [Crenobacter cavernae]|uniref:DUF2779 domain-containing protein n=2 Tax=Crenobacter cavernae TaxID=2290923 RepID=A0A345Y234_9NEIS|nr:DUF2779 domain-containing protein [Crenobacter cavernae]